MILRLVCLCAFSMLALSAQDKKPLPAALPPPETPSEAPAAVDLKSFIIGADDVLGIRVWREPELSSTLRVRPDGKITLPLGGEVVAAGRTPNQLGQDIAKVLASFVNSPLVMVSLTEVRSTKYLINGEVGRPGSYPLVTPVTVLDAIIQAGGFKEYAKKKKITILRKGEVLKFNYEDYVKGKNAAQNIHLQDGDLVVVK